MKACCYDNIDKDYKHQIQLDVLSPNYLSPPQQHGGGAWGLTVLQRYYRDSVPIMPKRERHLFFPSKDRTVTLTRQDFLPDRTADGGLLFTFSSNISDFRKSISSYLKFGSRHEDSSQFYR